MKKLNVRIIHRSGRVTTLTSHDYYEGQFKEWCIRNFQKPNGDAFHWTIWNDVMLNLNEIEKIEEIK